jgi:hypothetical protein
MRKLASVTLSLFLLSGTAYADTPKEADAPPAKPAQPAKPKAAKRTDKSDSAIAAQLEELREALQAQQEQLQLLKEELAKRDRQIDEAREAAAAANARAAEASTKATEAVNSTAEIKSSEASLNTTGNDIKASNDALKATAITVAEDQEKKKDEEGYATIRYKGINITPGGFFAAETVFRNRAESADVNTQFSGIPYPGNDLSKVTENNFSARQSRLSLFADTKVGSAKVSGYFEGDLLGAGTTSNNRQTNSYVFRQRQFWGQAQFDNGWQFTGGQMWSLATEGKKGINNRQENLPLQIDPQYVVGFTWARQYAFRVVKAFGDKFAVGVSVEGPQSTIGGRGFSSVTTTTVGSASVATSGNFFINAPGNSAGLYNAFDPTGYTVNKAPDFLFKATADPGFGHYEVFGIVSTFRNRVYPCGAAASNTGDTSLGNTTPPTPPTFLPCTDGTTTVTAPSAINAFNDTRTGGGGGASALFSLFNKKVDFGVKGVAGDGIGRYGSAQLADLTIRPDGTQALIRTAHGLARLEFHPTPKLDIYAYYGGEYAWRAGYQGYTSVSITRTPGIPANTAAGSPAIAPTQVTSFRTNQIGGYGSPFANNSGCESIEATPTTANNGTPAAATCAGDIRNIQEGTLGFWYKFYQGPKGRVQFGVQYSYLTRFGWSGNNSAGGTSTAAGISPKAVDNMVLTSFRFYIP